jgi:hypothetical protein
MEIKLTHKDKIRRLTLLINFMQSNNILKPFFLNFNNIENVKWRKNIRLNKHYTDLRDYCHDLASYKVMYISPLDSAYNQIISFDEFFIYAFDWLNTNETAPYWNSISYEWRKYLKKYDQ